MKSMPDLNNRPLSVMHRISSRLQRLKAAAGRRKQNNQGIFIFSHEQGSALVLVMFIALLFTLLGVTVLSAAVGGAQRAETRKFDVQTLHLAEKTLEKTVATMTAKLEEKVMESRDFGRQELDNRIDAYLAALKNNPDELLPVNTNLSEADGRILDVDYDRVMENGQLVNYKVMLTAEAEVNGVQRELEQEIVFDTFPDFLKYTLGSEGNVYLNGSPQITGNIYAGNKLYIQDMAEYRYQASERIMRSEPFELTGEAHVQSLDGVIYTQNGQSETAGKLDEQQRSWNNMIPLNRIKIKNQKKFVQVNVTESFIDKVEESLNFQSGGSLRNSIRNSLKGGNLGAFLRGYPAQYDAPDQPVKPDVPDVEGEALDDAAIPEDLSPEEQEEWRLQQEQRRAEWEERKRLWEEYRELIRRFTEPQRSFVFKGDLDVDGAELKGIRTQPGSWYVVDGNVKIDNYTDEPIVISANMLITGSLEIRGKVQLNSTIFVLGTGLGEGSYAALVEDASIDGLGVVLSKGSILINRFDAFQNTAQELNAFFYTDESAELYGVGSIFTLHGGFFAKKELTVNAVRGNAAPGSGDIQIDAGSGLVRFQASYDENVYESQAGALPRVNQISVRVGNIRLK
ncbi:hypothetical protein [Paenibacillus lemnae]|uniref:Type 4 fimbrial biogenesis protein PilX N-terminal domain-containing protein n=1 Tax=Paenibacillus lemnae TaxID=1330551 RepID=A0A848M907_PAELE|nr:hypothetical protein [Paenibacillus lemnae]NMO96660.1 hypothetical protein [Paenibacillus lemnae]